MLKEKVGEIKKPPTGYKPIPTDVVLSLADILATKVVEFEVSRYNLKPDVKPTMKDLTCNKCNGDGGMHRISQMMMGSIGVSTDMCKNCDGCGIIFPDEFFILKTQKLRKTINKGAKTNDSFVIHNKGHELPECVITEYKLPSDMVRTDLIIKIQVAKTITVDGITYGGGNRISPYSLELVLNVEPHEVLCGCYKSFKYIDGSQMCIKITKGVIFSPSTIIIPSKGLPFHNSDKKGYLYIELNIVGEFNISDESISRIWSLMTNGTKKQDEESKILKKTNGEYIESVIFKKYEESQAFIDSQNILHEHLRREKRNEAGNSHPFNRMFQHMNGMHQQDENNTSEEGEFDDDARSHGMPTFQSGNIPVFQSGGIPAFQSGGIPAFQGAGPAECRQM